MSEDNKKNSNRQFAGGPVVRTSQGGNSQPEDKPSDATNTAGWHKVYVPVSTVQPISDTAGHPEGNPFTDDGSHRVIIGVDMAAKDGDSTVVFRSCQGDSDCGDPECERHGDGENQEGYGPVVCFQKDLECPRCKGVGKIQNTNPRLLVAFIDCPDCEGQGKTVAFDSISEPQLDEGVALGMELAQLRRAKKNAYEATCKILGILNLAHSLASNTTHIQAEAAAKNIKEAIKEVGFLQLSLREGGDQ